MVNVDSLDHREQVALVVIVKALVTADAQVSAEEVQALGSIAAKVGGDVMRVADSVKVGAGQLQSFLGTVTRQMARETIYDIVLDIAKADGLQAEESSILDTIADAWDIVTVESHS